MKKKKNVNNDHLLSPFMATVVGFSKEKQKEKEKKKKKKRRRKKLPSVVVSLIDRSIRSSENSLNKRNYMESSR